MIRRSTLSGVTILLLTIFAHAEPARVQALAELDAQRERLVELRDAGQFPEAAAIGDRIVKILPELEKQLGRNNENLGWALNQIGWLYREMGRYPEAERLFRVSFGVQF